MLQIMVINGLSIQLSLLIVYKHHFLNIIFAAREAQAAFLGH